MYSRKNHDFKIRKQVIYFLKILKYVALEYLKMKK